MQNWQFLEDKWSAEKIDETKKDNKIGKIMFAIGFAIAFVAPLLLGDFNNFLLVN